MFCPKCGNADQKINSYCRNCGTFLPDFDAIKRKETTAEEHLKANAVLNIMTALACLILSILLYVYIFSTENGTVLIYVTAGFLTAMFAWQVQIFWRTLKIKKQIILPKSAKKEKQEKLESIPTKELLNEANFSDIIPASATEHTTTKLSQNVKN
jgi:K+-sensing histidine kinase KdpD